MKHSHRFDHDRYRVIPNKTISLEKTATEPDDGFKKSEVKDALEVDVSDLTESQRVLWASETNSLLIILQGMDAAGKDGTIRHVMSGVNPQGCDVYSFKAPVGEELKHHFLWRAEIRVPARGRIAIFNRSYYEEVLVVRVHPQFLEQQNLPPADAGKDIWQTRFEMIRNWEEMLTQNGMRVLKFYLHVSRKEQKERFLERLENHDKYWKFNERDIEERTHWPKYMEAYDQMLEQTSTERSPWYVIPADKKWFSRALVADIITAAIDDMDLSYPQPDKEAVVRIKEARQRLLDEKV